VKKIGVCSGSFDPITNGHLWVIEEGKKLFDEFHVLIGPVAKKDTLFTPQERKTMIEKVVKPPVIVDILHTGNILWYTNKLEGEVYLLRGIRNESDCKYELDITKCIRAAGGNCHYLFVTPPSELEGTSSTYTKYLCASNQWDEVARRVPPHVKDELFKAYQNRRKTFITTAEVASLYPASIFETTTAGFGPADIHNADFCQWSPTERKDQKDITLLSTSGHQIPMVDELEEILDHLGPDKVNIHFFGKMRDNFKQLEANGFVKFADYVMAEQVRLMLDPCWMDVVSSESYDLKEIPLTSVKPMGERYMPCSQSLGPIIVDLKPKAIDWNNDLPPVVVIEGKHRWLDAQERGDKKIMAYVGNKAMKYFKGDNNAD